MRWMCLGLLVVGACGDGASSADVAETAVAETSESDTAEQETSAPDGSESETSGPETIGDTSGPETVDTSAPETTAETIAPETTTSRCGCVGGTSCLEGNDAASCPSVVSLCGNGMAIVDACSSDDVMATCVRSSTTLKQYFARLDDYLVKARDACVSALSGAAGVYSVTPIPTAVGDVCSCQRTAAACTQTYGATCDTLVCDAGLQAAPCASEGRIPARCVSRDAQRELVFYSAGVSEDGAQLACLGASAVEYFWFPDGL